MAVGPIPDPTGQTSGKDDSSKRIKVDPTKARKRDSDPANFPDYFVDFYNIMKDFIDLNPFSDLTKSSQNLIKAKKEELNELAKIQRYMQQELTARKTFVRDYKRVSEGLLLAMGKELAVRKQGADLSKKELKERKDTRKFNIDSFKLAKTRFKLDKDELRHRRTSVRSNILNKQPGIGRGGGGIKPPRYPHPPGGYEPDDEDERDKTLRHTLGTYFKTYFLTQSEDLKYYLKDLVSPLAAAFTFTGAVRELLESSAKAADLGAEQARIFGYVGQSAESFRQSIGDFYTGQVDQVNKFKQTVAQTSKKLGLEFDKTEAIYEGIYARLGKVSVDQAKEMAEDIIVISRAFNTSADNVLDVVDHLKNQVGMTANEATDYMFSFVDAAATLNKDLMSLGKGAFEIKELNKSLFDLVQGTVDFNENGKLVVKTFLALGGEMKKFGYSQRMAIKKAEELTRKLMGPEAKDNILGLRQGFELHPVVQDLIKGLTNKDEIEKKLREEFTKDKTMSADERTQALQSADRLAMYLDQERQNKTNPNIVSQALFENTKTQQKLQETLLGKGNTYLDKIEEAAREGSTPYVAGLTGLSMEEAQDLIFSINYAKKDFTDTINATTDEHLAKLKTKRIGVAEGKALEENKPLIVWEAMLEEAKSHTMLLKVIAASTATFAAGSILGKTGVLGWGIRGITGSALVRGPLGQFAKGAFGIGAEAVPGVAGAAGVARGAAAARAGVVGVEAAGAAGTAGRIVWNPTLGRYISSATGRVVPTWVGRGAVAGRAIGNFASAAAIPLAAAGEGYEVYQGFREKFRAEKTATEANDSMQRLLELQRKAIKEGDTEALLDLGERAQGQAQIVAKTRAEERYKTGELAGGIGGAAVGGLIGTLLLPGVGTALGLTVGGFIGRWIGKATTDGLEEETELVMKMRYNNLRDMETYLKEEGRVVRESLALNKEYIDIENKLAEAMATGNKEEVDRLKIEKAKLGAKRAARTGSDQTIRRIAELSKEQEIANATGDTKKYLELQDAIERTKAAAGFENLYLSGERSEAIKRKHGAIGGTDILGFTSWDAGQETKEFNEKLANVMKQSEVGGAYGFKFAAKGNNLFRPEYLQNQEKADELYKALVTLQKYGQIEEGKIPADQAEQIITPRLQALETLNKATYGLIGHVNEKTGKIDYEFDRSIADLQRNSESQNTPIFTPEGVKREGTGVYPSSSPGQSGSIYEGPPAPDTLVGSASMNGRDIIIKVPNFVGVVAKSNQIMATSGNNVRV